MKEHKMAEHVYTDPSKRHDFTLIFDVQDGNPNGDPDAGNLPRTDPETMQGIVTDVSLKRKVRNYIATLASDETDPEKASRNKIFVEHHGVLNEQIERAYTELGLKKNSTKKSAKDDAEKSTLSAVQQARAWMCENFYDVRMFGAVMSTGLNAGQVRGPMQLTFARSVDPVLPQDISITRMAVTEAKNDTSPRQTMGRKTLIHYGLYVGHGFFSPHLASDTNVTEEDLATFWQALINMWSFDRSASRGMMAPRGLYIWSHENKLGNAPAHKLFESVQITRINEDLPPRSFKDYSISVEETSPDGVTLKKLIEG
jgi:CRISPR-associated protein Csd2